MYVFYNPHPDEKLVGDCVKRALTKSSGKTYQEVSNELNRIKRELGEKAYNSNPVWRKYIKDKMAVETLSFPAVKGEPRMNGHKFCGEYPEGTYILRMARHLSCVVDGVIYDTWDCSDKCVYTAWRVNSTKEYEGVNDMEEVNVLELQSCAANVPSHGVEEVIEDGVMLMNILADVTGIPCKVNRKGEQWISLTPARVSDVVVELMNREYLRCQNRRGSLTSKWWDERNGMTIILKQGENPYVWCTEVGTSDKK